MVDEFESAVNRGDYVCPVKCRHCAKVVLDKEATKEHWCEGCHLTTKSWDKVFSHPFARAGEPPGRTCHHCDYHNLTSLNVRSNPLALLHPCIEDGKVRFQRTWEEVRREEESQTLSNMGIVH